MYVFFSLPTGYSSCLLQSEIEKIELAKANKDHEKKGYEKKLAEEQEKLATLNGELEATKQEHEVRLFLKVSCAY